MTEKELQEIKDYIDLSVGKYTKCLYMCMLDLLPFIKYYKKQFLASYNFWDKNLENIIINEENNEKK